MVCYAVGIPYAPDSARSPLITDDTASGPERLDRVATLERGLRRTLEALASTQARVWIVEQVPELEVNAPTALARLALSGRDLTDLDVTVAAHERQQRDVSRIISGLQGTLRLNRINPARVLCDTSSCKIQQDGRSLYYDNHHLSAFGAAYVMPALDEIFAYSDRNSPSQPNRTSPAMRSAGG
jgi:hypothetical protein